MPNVCFQYLVWRIFNLTFSRLGIRLNALEASPHGLHQGGLELKSDRVKVGASHKTHFKEHWPPFIHSGSTHY
jgi:hypothetical protein